MPIADFMAAIDATGGWPIGYKYVQFYHAADWSGRVCIFNNLGQNTEWWTTVCTSDDYYWFKLSDAKKTVEANKSKRDMIQKLLHTL
jgi:hypothetical protein